MTTLPLPTLELPAVRADRSWIERGLTGALFALTLMAAAGYATFALHPERLASAPQAAVVYGYALRILPPAHILAGLLTLGVILSRRTGGAWLPAALWLYLISLSSEMLGTTLGVPFGPYHYSRGLGIMWFEHVPVLIPASWFMMALPSFVLASRWVTTRTLARVPIAAALLVSWDLALDPAMSRLMPYWVWGSAGPYFGMPLLNLVGWYATGLALMVALARLRIDRWTPRIPTLAFAAIYLANLTLPALMAIAGGFWPAALLAAIPITVAAACDRFRARRGETI